MTQRVIVTMPDYTRPEDVADYLRTVADQIEESYSSGHVGVDQHWTSENVS